MKSRIHLCENSQKRNCILEPLNIPFWSGLSREVVSCTLHCKLALRGPDALSYYSNYLGIYSCQECPDENRFLLRHGYTVQLFLCCLVHQACKSTATFTRMVESKHSLTFLSFGLQLEW